MKFSKVYVLEMKIDKILLLSLVGISFLLLIGYITWRGLIIQANREDAQSCGGDWSYNIKCPHGSICLSRPEDIFWRGVPPGGWCVKIPFISR